MANPPKRAVCIPSNFSPQPVCEEADALLHTGLFMVIAHIIVLPHLPALPG